MATIASDCLSADAWLEIIDLEKKAGDVGRTSVLYTQAIRCLEGGLVEDFINRQTLRSAQQTAM